MAEWKKELRRLAKDFCLSKCEYQRISRKIEELYGTRDIPSYYNGDRNEFLYDKGHTEIMNKIYA